MEEVDHVRESLIYQLDGMIKIIMVHDA